MKFILNTFKFPTVYVKITNDKDQDNKSYHNLINKWCKFYKKKRHFHFIFDFTNLDHCNINLIPTFVKTQMEFKKQETQYLDYSIVVLNNKLLMNILTKLLHMITPISIIYISNNLENSKTLLNYLNNPFISNKFIDTFLLIHNITKI